MSSRNKDTLEKRDIPSESSESHSDSEVNKAEENLDQLMTEERLTKDDSGESKPLNPPKQVGTLTSKYDPLNEPIAGPSGLQEPRLETSHPESKVESLSDPQKEKNVEAKDIDDNIEASMVEEDFDTTSSTSMFIPSSTGVTTSSKLQEKSPVAGTSRLQGEVDYWKLHRDAVSIYMTESSGSSSSRLFDYASDSAHTLSDVSEIRSEATDISTEGVTRDAPESLDKDQSSRYANPDLQSSSGSYEPKSSSSGESHRKESPDITSSREVQEFSKSQTGRKSWQKSGLLRSMELPAMSSKDSVIAEEDDRTSHLRGEDELIETKDPTPEKMETALDIGSEGAAENTQRSELMPVVESSHLVYGSEVGGTSKEHEQSSEISELERSVRKSKREPKLSSSTSSDKEQSSSSPKVATSRPKKRARCDKMPGKTRKTRQDSGGTVPKSVGLDNLQQSESTSTPDPGDCTTDSSDYTPSDSESETAI